MNSDLDLVARIDRFLPQTQCTECGEPSCMEYAEAVAAGRAGIDQCPPGGAATVAALSRLLGRPRPESPVSPSPNSSARPASPSPSPSPSPAPPSPTPPSPAPLQLAFIREADCIGCKLCIDACPVDCIIGAVKLMHTVIAGQCSGCRLCAPVCPTDCIEMVAPPPDYATDAPGMWAQFSHAQVQQFRRRAVAKREREAAAKNAPRRARPATPTRRHARGNRSRGGARAPAPSASRATVR